MRECVRRERGRGHQLRLNPSSGCPRIQTRVIYAGYGGDLTRSAAEVSAGWNAAIITLPLVAGVRDAWPVVHRFFGFRLSSRLADLGYPSNPRATATRHTAPCSGSCSSPCSPSSLWPHLPLSKRQHQGGGSKHTRPSSPSRPSLLSKSTATSLPGCTCTT